jgi:hypothetical protein
MKWLEEASSQELKRFAQTIEDKTLVNDLGPAGITENKLYRSISSALRDSVMSGYGTKYVLAGPRGTGTMEADEALHLMSLAVIQMAGKDQEVRKRLVKEMTDIYILPDLEIQPEKVNGRIVLEVALNGHQLFPSGALNRFLQTAEGYNATPYAPKGQSGLDLQDENRASQYRGEASSYLDHVRKVGYLVFNTLLYIDAPQVMVRFRDDYAGEEGAESTTYTDEQGRQRYVDDDAIAREPYKPGNVWDKQGPSWEFTIGGPLANNIEQYFPFLAPYRVSGTRFSQKKAFIDLLQEVGLAGRVDITPPAPNTGAKKERLSDYQDIVLKNLIDQAPPSVSEEEVVKAFQEQGSLPKQDVMRMFQPERAQPAAMPQAPGL